ncbi:MAG: hypothetical protein ABSG21_07630 [Spirochaetia bacterium]|jgi:hypothetical protein
MKRLLLVLIIALLPALAFADLQIGAVGIYNGNITAVASSPQSTNNFTFGGEARLKIWIIQGGLTALYYPSSSGNQIVALTDIGVSLDVLFLRFGAGIGPDFAFPVSGSAPQPSNVGMNLKFSGEIKLGGLSLGLVGFYYFDSLSNIGNVFGNLPSIGATIMIRLF